MHTLLYSIKDFDLLLLFLGMSGFVGAQTQRETVAALLFQQLLRCEVRLRSQQEKRHASTHVLVAWDRATGQRHWGGCTSAVWRYLTVKVFERLGLAVLARVPSH